MTRLAEWRAAGDRFTFRGHGIHYRRGGSGEPLLLLHGFPTSSWDWHRVWDGLCAHFDVVAPDLLGFGFSDKPTDHEYLITEQADLAEALLSELGLGSAHLLAHDYGDSVAQELLAREAASGIELRSACLLNGGIIPGTHRPLAIQRLLMSPAGPLLGRCIGRGSLRRSFDRIFGPSTKPTDSEIDEFWSVIQANRGRRVMHKIIRYMAERERHAGRWIGILLTTQVPVRLVNGLADPISGAHVVDAYRTLVPEADVVELDGIGHYPQIEAPEQVLDAVVRC